MCEKDTSKFPNHALIYKISLMFVRKKMHISATDLQIKM